MKNIKNSFILSIISVIIGGIQMALFLPNGLSCSDGESSLLDGMLYFMPFQFLFVFILSLFNSKTINYIILFTVLLFWFYINKIEFTNRHACWSTFSDSEILISTLLKSTITCFIPILTLYLIMRKMKRFSI
jgi:hypothetical protein